MVESCELAELLMRASQSIAKDGEDALKELGLSMAKYHILNALADAGGRLPFSVLVERLGCVRSNITGLVDRLQEDRLVRRVDHPEDRRMLFAEITEEGRRLISLAEPSYENAIEHAFGTLTPQQHEILGNLLRTFVSTQSTNATQDTLGKEQTHQRN
jgi:MarR family 2-MHQ and catechol resistance regulon transcriptional repressor